ncbi:MAG: argininosuccinate lyase [Proteobacteria bacterium]|nr:argininosuccinate lyase [Pseudomonadota bacterium]
MGVLITDRNRGGERALYEFTGGIEFDLRLAQHEIRVQRAWARALGGGGYLDPEETEAVLGLLERALGKISDNTFDWRVEDEDIHMNLERFVTGEAGDLGRKMHMGRSRNDLVATTLRLFAAKCAEDTASRASSLSAALCDLGERCADAIVPGTTHLQHAQPVSFGHIASAHALAFVRDLRRLRSARDACLDRMPLGSAALSGTPLRVDLVACAEELGFCSPPMNSYDAVGDRDFMIELMDAFASVAVHTGRLSEDIVIWSSTAVGLIDLPAEHSTGSSIMPNKRNPDVAECARARAARIVSLSNEAHSIAKSLPTSYASDLHELKKTFIRAFDETREVLSALTPLIRGLALNRERARELLGRGHILATEMADALASQGMPFREAYAATASMVERAERMGVQVHEVTRKGSREALPVPNTELAERISFESAVERRSQPGGTKTENVLDCIMKIREIAKGY